jgi:hypothetical protein
MIIQNGTRVRFVTSGDETRVKPVQISNGDDSRIPLVNASPVDNSRAHAVQVVTGRDASRAPYIRVVPWELPWITEFWDVLTGTTVTGAGASAVAPIKGTHSLSQGTDANRMPLSGGLLGSNGSQFITSGAWAVAQPFSFAIALKQNAWTDGKTIIDFGSAAALIYQTPTASPNVTLYAGTAFATATTQTVGALRV